MRTQNNFYKSKALIETEGKAQPQQNLQNSTDQKLNTSIRQNAGQQ